MKLTFSRVVDYVLIDIAQANDIPSTKSLWIPEIAIK